MSAEASGVSCVNASAFGQRINYANFDGDPKFMTIVGIVADVRNSLEIRELCDVYVHYLQRGAVDNFTLVVHAVGQTENVTQQVMSEVRVMNSEASTRVQAMDQMFASNMTNASRAYFSRRGKTNFHWSRHRPDGGSRCKPATVTRSAAQPAELLSLPAVRVPSKRTTQSQPAVE